MVPEVIAPFASSIPVNVFVNTDLPEPDSPTIASVSCSFSSRETLRMARNSLLRTLKPTEIFSALKIVFLSILTDSSFYMCVLGSAASANVCPTMYKETETKAKTVTGIQNRYG